MNRRNPIINTLILGVVFAALLAYVLYNQSRGSLSSNPLSTPQPTPVAVFDFLSDNVAKFQARDLSKNVTVVVTRQDAGWHMEQPKDSATDPFRASNPILEMSHLQSTRVLTNATDLGSYGLITPTLEARATLSDTTEYVLQIGDPNLDKTSYYALKGGDKQVYLISSTFVTDLQDYLANPPYPATPTLTPLPTLTPSTTPTATTTPPTATPTGTTAVPGTPAATDTPPATDTPLPGLLPSPTP